MLAKVFVKGFYVIVNDNCVLFRTKRNLSKDHPYLPYSLSIARALL